MNQIRRVEFILMVVKHFENRPINPISDWTIEDSFVHIASSFDLADMSHDEYNRLLNDCKYNVNNYLTLEV
jgi:hypothetical protein